jgi:hypothetical protein
LPPLKITDSSSSVEPLDASHFKLTVPDIVGVKLLLRQEQVKKFLNSPHTKARMEERIRSFNVKFNPSGTFFEIPTGQGQKKRDSAEANLANSEEPPLKLPKLDQDPADLSSLDSSSAVLTTSIEDMKVVLHKGDVFITSDKDCTVPKDMPFGGMGFGKWIDGVALPLAEKAVQENPSLFLIPLQLATDDDLVMVQLKGLAELKKGVSPPPDTPQPLWKVMKYLEDCDITDAKIVNHSLTRQTSNDANDAGRPRFSVSHLTRIVFQPKQQSQDLKTFWALNVHPDKLANNDLLKYVVKLEYLVKFRSFVPELCFLCFTKNLEVKKGELVRITGRT